METTIQSHGGVAGTASLHSSQQRYSGSWSQRISWPAVFAGLILAIFLQLALTLLGVSIGMSTVDAVNRDTPGTGLAIGSGIWSVLSLVFSLFTGGWVAGRLAKNKHTSESAIHGLLVAGLMFILTFYLLSSAVGNLIGGAGRMAGGAISNAAPSIRESVEERYQTSSSSGGDQLASDNARLTSEISSNRAEIEQRALQVADDAADATGKAAIYSFIGISLGALAAGFGAKKGRDSKMPDGYDTYYQDDNQHTRSAVL